MTKLERRLRDMMDQLEEGVGMLDGLHDLVGSCKDLHEVNADALASMLNMISIHIRSAFPLSVAEILTDPESAAAETEDLSPHEKEISRVFDIDVEWPDGSVGRPTVTMVQDEATNCVRVVLRIEPKDSSHA